MSFGMPTNRPRLTSDIRIMGFLRIPKTETIKKKRDRALGQ